LPIRKAAATAALAAANPVSTTYGSAPAPTDLGSGGGVYNVYTGVGGGAIRLIVTGTLTNNGIISANAAPVTGAGGGGAGGSVYVTTARLRARGSSPPTAAQTPARAVPAAAADASPSTTQARRTIAAFATSTANGGTPQAWVGPTMPVTLS